MHSWTLRNVGRFPRGSKQRENQKQSDRCELKLGLPWFFLYVPDLRSQIGFNMPQLEGRLELSKPFHKASET